MQKSVDCIPPFPRSQNWSSYREFNYAVQRKRCSNLETRNSLLTAAEFSQGIHRPQSLTARDTGTAVGQGGVKKLGSMEISIKQKIAINMLVSVLQQCW